MIKPFYETNGLVLEAAQSILGYADAVGLFEYNSPLGTERKLASAVRWLQKYKVNVTKHGVMIAAGAQNALSVILISLFQAGDKIAVDEFTYTNFKGLTNLLHIQLIAVCADEYGMLPSALAALQKGVHILGSHRFQQGNQNNAAYVRLSIISPDTEEELSHALEILRKILWESQVSFLV